MERLLFLLMGTVRKAQGLILFACVGFWPVLFFLVLFGIGIAIDLLIGASTGGFSAGRLSDISTMAAAWFFPAMVIIASYHLCASAGWGKRGWIMYGTWFVLLLEITFLLAAAIGGMSDSAAPIRERYNQYLFAAIVGTLWAHVVMVPWVLLALFVLRKIGEKRVFP